MHTHLALGFTIALGSALLAIPTAWADTGFRCGQGHAMSHHGHGETGVTGHMLQRLLSHQQEIGLSDEQVAKLRSVALDADRSAIRASADRLVSERELRAMMWDAKAEMPAIEAKVKEAESLEAAVRIIGIRAKRELMAVLTPEQQTKLKALRHASRHHEAGARTAGALATERSPGTGIADVGRSWTIHIRSALPRCYHAATLRCSRSEGSFREFICRWPMTRYPSEGLRARRAILSVGSDRARPSGLPSSSTGINVTSAGIVGRRVPAEQVRELVHEVFVKATSIWRSFRTRFPSNIGWPASPCAPARFWRARAREEVPVSALSDEHPGWIEQTLPSQSDRQFRDQTAKQEAAEVLEWALRQLSPENRAVLTLVHLDGLFGTGGGAIVRLESGQCEGSRASGATGPAYCCATHTESAHDGP